MAKKGNKIPIVDEVSDTIIGNSLKYLKEIVIEYARGGHSILFAGAPGVGKELFADLYAAATQREIHPINMTGIPANLIESILFGHVKGAFTDATKDKDGHITKKNMPKLCFFFDELGDIPSDLQAKLLRFVQFGEIQKVGKTEPIKIDPKQLRIVAASNKPECIRDDLKDRFKCLRIPTLVERYHDIPELMKHFLEDPAVTGITEYTLNGVSNIVLVEDEYQSLDKDKYYSHIHQWKGNVRELKQVLDNAVFLCKKRKDDTLHCEDFPTFFWKHKIPAEMLKSLVSDFVATGIKTRMNENEEVVKRVISWPIPAPLSKYKELYGSGESYNDESSTIKINELPVEPKTLPYHYFLQGLPEEVSREDQLKKEINGLRSELNKINKTMSSANKKIPSPETHQKDQITYDNTTPKAFDEQFYNHQARQKMTVPQILKQYNLAEGTVKKKLADARKRIKKTN
jgi:hypothetical protein